MDAYAIHLAMAALVGASFVAVSAYYMHRKTLTQLLEFARTVEREREREDAEDELGRGDSPQHFKKHPEKRRNHVRRKGNGYHYRASTSLPDVTAVTGAVDVDEGRNGPLSVDGIPAGLPRLHTLPEGKSAGHASSTKRATHLIRATSPKSPVASASAFESVEGSDDEDNMTDNAKLDTTYLHTNGNVGPECNNMFQNLPDHSTANGEQMPIVAPSMIRSHSVSGDLHGVQPDPVAADILRKEPEHETFVRLKISPTAKDNLFPIADATTFFTDLHFILKVIALGNIRTLSHHRLVLLEQAWITLVGEKLDATLTKYVNNLALVAQDRS